MPFYRDQVVPRLVGLTCGSSALSGLRARTADGLSGRVVEIGFGSGYNVPHYPQAVSCVLAVEPSATAFRMAAKRIGASAVPIEQVGLDGQSLPLDDASCDGALCTFSLCTIPDPDAALAEVWRVLVPGGRFHFLEHGLAPDPKVVAFQHRVEPLQRRLAAGCHLTRDPLALARSAGFEVDDVEQMYGSGPKAWVYLDPGFRGAGVTGDEVGDVTAERIERLERRLEAAESVLAIQDLKARYAAVVDARFARGVVVGRAELEDLAGQAAATVLRRRGVERRPRSGRGPG